MNELLQTLLDWIALHPYAFNAAVFCISLMESLVVLGLLIPGAAMLFGAGALVATGALPLYPVLFWTIAGAITGDFLSYFLGHHYHQRLRVMWPFRRYPELVNRGVDFFVRHGGKSIFMARFIGPLRPIVPAIAGMMNMTPGRFLLIDVFACILWAPAYILPGIVFGASLGLAAEVAGRLVVLLVTITACVWLGFWLAGSLIRLLRPHAVNALDRILNWSRDHPRIQPLAGSLLDPDHPEARGLATLSALFFITLWLLLLISTQVLNGQLLGGIDTYLFHTLEQLRTPWVDSAMVFFNGLGNQKLLAIVLTGGCLWLFWQGRIQAALHWLAAYLCAGLLTWILKFTARIDPPLDFIDSYSFPGAHTTMSLVVYGFLALLIARELPVTRRWLPYMTAGLLVAPIALSRVYLGAQWFSDVLAGVSLGVIWVTLIGIAYDRHPAPRLPVRRLLLVATTLLLVAVSWQTRLHYSAELALYAPRIQTQVVSQDDWINSDWQSLPVHRIDIEGKHDQPINFQWGGSLSALQQVLASQGWSPAPAINPVSAMNWLAPEPAISALPVLPEVNDGRHQVLLMIAPRDAAENNLTVLRLWPSDRQLEDSGARIWAGKVATLYVEDQLRLISYLRAADDYIKPLDVLFTSLENSSMVETRLVKRTVPAQSRYWDGKVLLAWEDS